jgi:hypothetical protein
LGLAAGSNLKAPEKAPTQSKAEHLQFKAEEEEAPIYGAS